MITPVTATPHLPLHYRQPDYRPTPPASSSPSQQLPLRYQEPVYPPITALKPLQASKPSPAAGGTGDLSGAVTKSVTISVTTLPNPEANQIDTYA